MVGIFSRFSINRSGHRRSQTALEGMEENRQGLGSRTTPAIITPPFSCPAPMAVHGLEIAVEFKPLDHPIEPISNDAPIQCPLVEPCILNDRRIWKQRIADGDRRRSGPEGAPQADPKTAETKPRRRVQSRHGSGILPSSSAPERSIIKLLDECNAS